MSIRRAIIIGCLAASTAGAQLTVTGIDSTGLLTWTNDVTTGYIRVEWSHDLANTNGWQSSWSNLWSFGAGAAESVSAPIPRYYRVAHSTNAFDADADVAIGAGESDYAVDFSMGSFPNLAVDALYAIDWLSGTNWVRDWRVPGNIAATGHLGYAAVPVTMRVRILSTNVPPAVSNMVWVFEGTYAAGAPGATRSVTLPGYYLDRTEVTEELWAEVATWAATNGYSLADPLGLETHGAAYPVVGVSWYEAAAWCNARSERDALQAAYYLDATLTNAWRGGDVPGAIYQAATTSVCYRLPTEAEWERGARGFLAGAWYPWGATNAVVEPDLANIRNSGDLSELLTTLLTPAGGHQDLRYAYVGDLPAPAGEEMSPWTTYVVVYPRNGWGAVDMAGNVWEWCSDWYRYETPTGTNSPTGPNSGTHRVIRGGSYGNDAEGCTVFHRGFQRPEVGRVCTGFRCVRSR